MKDGKILIEGDFIRVNGIERIGLALLNADGSLDMSFNANEVSPYFYTATRSLESDESKITSIVEQDDGKLLLGINLDEIEASGPILLRLNKDGSLDTDFQENLPFNDFSNFFVSSVAVQSDSKIILAGVLDQDGRNLTNVARLNIDGTIDSTFPEALAGVSDYRTVRVLSNDKLLFSNRDSLVRYHSDGTIDTDFGLDSTIAPTNILEIQPDGEIIVGISVTINGDNINRVARLHPNGSLDSSFETLSLPFPALHIGQIAYLQDGRYLAGTFFNSAEDSFNEVFRLKNDGSVDEIDPLDGDICAPIFAVDKVVSTLCF